MSTNNHNQKLVVLEPSVKLSQGCQYEDILISLGCIIFNTSLINLLPVVRISNSIV